MKNIFKIFLRDIHRIRTNVVAMVVSVGIMVIPALYAWFNLAANWDPYSNTNGIKVAVASEDTGVELQGKKVVVGDQIVTNLKANDKIGWTFVDGAGAEEGVRSGDYYAAIIIPESFSQDIVSFLTDDVTNPSIKYYVNEKKNAIAPKITNSGASTVQSTVNSTFVKTATDTILQAIESSSDLLGVDGNSFVSNLTSRLDILCKDLQDYSTTVDTFMQTGDSVDDLLQAAQLLMPDVDQAVENGQKAITDAQNSLNTAQTSITDVTNAVGTTLDSMQAVLDSVSAAANDALTNLEGDEKKVAGSMEAVGDKLKNVVVMNNQILNNLNTLNSSLPAPLDLSDITEQINGVSAKETEAANELYSFASDLNDSAAAALDAQTNVRNLLAESRETVSSIRSLYSSSVAPQLNASINALSVSLGDFSGMLTSVDSNLSDFDQVFDHLGSALNSGSASLKQTKTLIQNMIDKITKLEDELNSVGDNEKFQKLLEILQMDPDMLGDFMSSPVKLDTEALYPIENYGSAMTPFYTILAIWVGGIVLVAIMKVHVHEDDKIKNIKPHQAYFGRYLIFFVFGQIQALIICLGDLFYLKIQCEHPVMFCLVGAAAAFVFTLIIYTFTVSFGAIGKALSVIYLVLQVAGSGGTYPIEVLPTFFQNLYRFLPFAYSMTSMRECVAGMYGNIYWKNLGYLMIFAVAALILGLFIRIPIMKFMDFFEKRLEDSNLL